MTRIVPRERLVEYAFRIGWATARHSPEPVAERLLESAADRVWRSRGSGVRQLELNLARAAPERDLDELRALSQRAMQSYFRYWHEALRLPSWSASRIVDGVVTTGEEALRASFATGTGAVVALPHLANWDLAGAWACLTGMPVTTVAERLRPESLFERFVGYRTGLGMEVLPLDGPSGALSGLRASLRAGRLVCLVADRDLTGGGMEVTLLGEPARLPGGPAVLARLSGAPLYAAALRYRGPLMSIDFSPEIVSRPGRDGIRAMTQEVAEWFSRGIAAAPEDWHMLQPVFSRDLGGTGA